jgi:threonine/homoserine/homoserine lactone efflux protein
MLNNVLSFMMQGITLGLTASSTPGPFQAYLLAQVTRVGVKRTLPMCFAPLLSDGPIVVLVLILLTQLPSGFLRILQIVGGAFMIYLAWGMVDTIRNQESDASVPPKKQSYYDAVLMNIISPWPYIYWSTITGPLFLRAWHHSVVSGICFLFGFYFVLIGGFILVVIASGTALRLNRKLGIILTVASILTLVLFGVFQIWNGFLR